MAGPEISRQIRPAEVEWDIESVKDVLKTAISPSVKLAVDASGKCVKETYPSIPDPVIDWATDVSAQATTKCAEKALDQSVDSSFKNHDSLGSRVVLCVRSWF
ncbi:MAG: hypothetical protein KR126chlam6_01146 [Candidatus Anoxychlamydiales bacterium]|nr:hypothetical protein [Candidatus Anoxychlamydiales bacterium]